MNHKDQTTKRVSLIIIHVTRRMVFLIALGGLTVAFLGYLAWGSQEVAAANTKSITTSPPRIRRYYLTGSGYRGDEPLTTCAGGYHFASLWEIADPTNLEYNNTLGGDLGDGGSGPPTWYGWVRTGSDTSGSDPAGTANCLGWISDSNINKGTIAQLPALWTSADLHVWETGTSACGEIVPVWCVED
jgi:hypothetical protein